MIHSSKRIKLLLGEKDIKKLLDDDFLVMLKQVQNL